jgi:hypothetical protein
VWAGGEAEAPVGGQPFAVHAGQHRDGGVGVIVDLGLVFAGMFAQDPADVLGDGCFG